MKQKEKLFYLLNKNNGIITMKQATEAGIRRNIFKELVSQDKLVRIAAGLYGLPDEEIDEYSYLAHRVPKAVFSHNTAAYLHELTTRMPLVYTMTVKNGSNVSRITEDNVIFSYVNKEVFEIGKSKILTPFGREIFIYDNERTILDLIRNKEKTDTDIFSEVLKNYFKRNNKNLLKLSEYAIKMNMEEKLGKYTEVLL